MRTTIPLQSKLSRIRIVRDSSPVCAIKLQSTLAGPILAVSLLFVLQLFVLQPAAAQTPGAQPAYSIQRVRKPTHVRARPSAAHPLATLVAPLPALPAPPQPVLPKWPVNEKADQASVVWDSQGLRIDATNSSLQQILNDVSTATGAKVEGLGTDERIFGSYGPGQARDVLSQLLEGSGYNLLLIGDQGQGTPRQIVLSARPAGATSTTTRNNPSPDEDADIEEQPQPQEPPINRPGFPRGPGPMEMQQREQMLRNQQQLQGQPPNIQTNQPPNQPQGPPNQQPVNPPN